MNPDNEIIRMQQQQQQQEQQQQQQQRQHQRNPQDDVVRALYSPSHSSSSSSSFHHSSTSSSPPSTTTISSNNSSSKQRHIGVHHYHSSSTSTSYYQYQTRGKQWHPWRVDVQTNKTKKKKKKRAPPTPLLVFPKHTVPEKIVEEEEENEEDCENEKEEEEEEHRSIPTDEEPEHKREEEEEEDGVVCSLGGGVHEQQQHQQQHHHHHNEMTCACPDPDHHTIECCQERLFQQLEQKLANLYTGHYEIIETQGLGLGKTTTTSSSYYSYNAYCWGEEERFQQRQMQYVLREMHQTYLPKRRILSEATTTTEFGTTRNNNNNNKTMTNNSTTSTTCSSSNKEEEQRELHKIALQEMRALIFPHLPTKFHEVVEANGICKKLNEYEKQQQPQQEQVQQQQVQHEQQQQAATTCTAAPAPAAAVVVPAMKQEIHASLKAFEQMILSRQQANDENETMASVEWDEYTIEESVVQQQQQSIRSPDDDEWTEYTVEESVVTNNNEQQQQQQARLDAILASKSVVDAVPERIVGEHEDEQQHDVQDDEWTEYTVEESVNEEEQQARLDTILASKSGVDVVEVVDMVPMRVNSSQQQHHSGIHDDEWTEYTVEESVNIEEQQQQQQQQARLSAILASKGVMDKDAAVVVEQQQQQQQAPEHVIQGDEWTEYTVEETVAELPPPPQQQQQQQQQQEQLDAILLANKCSSANNSTPDNSPVDRVESYESCHEELHDELNALAMPSFTSGTHVEGEEDDDDDEYTEITMLEEDHMIIAEPITSPVSLGRGTFTPRLQREQSSCNSNAADDDDEEEEDGFTIHLQINPLPRKMDSITDETDALSDDESTAYNSAREDHGASAPGSPMSASSSSSSKHIAQLLRQDVWSADSETVQAALEELSQQASQGSAHRATIVRYGGLLAFTRAMQTHRSHIGIQIAACECLTQMARDTESRFAINQVGGLEAAVVSMQVHAADLKLHQAACATIAQLTQDGAANQIHVIGAVDTLTKSMATFKYHPKIQQFAFQALANLCLEHPERLQELSQSGGMTAMTEALQRPWESSSDKHEAISTLSILLRSLAANDS